MNKASTSISAMGTNQSTSVCQEGSILCSTLIGFAAYDAAYNAMDILIPRDPNVDCYAKLSSQKDLFKAMFTNLCLNAAQTMAVPPVSLVGRTLADRITLAMDKMVAA